MLLQFGRDIQWDMHEREGKLLGYVPGTVRQYGKSNPAQHSPRHQKYFGPMARNLTTASKNS